MTGIIPEEDEEEHELYDDVGAIVVGNDSEPIDEDIYEELPGPTSRFINTVLWLLFSFYLLIRRTIRNFTAHSSVLFLQRRSMPVPAKPPVKVEPANKPAPPPAAGITQHSHVYDPLHVMWIHPVEKKWHLGELAVNWKLWLHNAGNNFQPA